MTTKTDLEKRVGILEAELQVFDVADRVYPLLSSAARTQLQTSVKSLIFEKMNIDNPDGPHLYLPYVWIGKRCDTKIPTDEDIKAFAGRIERAVIEFGAEGKLMNPSYIELYGGKSLLVFYTYMMEDKKELFLLENNDATDSL